MAGRGTKDARQASVWYMRTNSRPAIGFPESAGIRLPAVVGGAAKAVLVDGVIQRLGLTKAAGTLVGGGLVQGVSGGERKRTNIGTPERMNLNGVRHGLQAALRPLEPASAAYGATCAGPSIDTYAGDGPSIGGTPCLRCQLHLMQGWSCFPIRPCCSWMNQPAVSEQRQQRRRAPPGPHAQAQLLVLTGVPAPLPCSMSPRLLACCCVVLPTTRLSSPHPSFSSPPHSPGNPISLRPLSLTCRDAQNVMEVSQGSAAPPACVLAVLLAHQAASSHTASPTRPLLPPTPPPPFAMQKALLALAGEGRAVVCTIHQPRSSIFALFDRLLGWAMCACASGNPATCRRQRPGKGGGGRLPAAEQHMDSALATALAPNKRCIRISLYLNESV